MDWLAKLFGDKSPRGQRKRAWWLIFILAIAFAVVAYLWVALRSSPMWWPFILFEGIDPVYLRWLDWLFTGAMGTLIYLLWEVAQHFRELNSQTGVGEPGQLDFVNYTPWYLVTALRGPIVVLVVMFTLTNVTLATALTGTDASGGPAIGIAIDLSNADRNLLALIAFTLGFFNRLPVHLMEQIARGIFSSAMEEAYGPEKSDD